VSCGSGSAPTSTTPTSTSPSYPNHHINRYLRRGSQGDDVQWLQLWLFQNGYYPQDLITGYYGDLTQSAVQNYQSKNGIVSSGSPDSTGWGNVGPRTEQEINQQSGD
jgi:peptidoglycan hydrolase-like protein with peptidoglycan-binding domain